MPFVSDRTVLKQYRHLGYVLQGYDDEIQKTFGCELMECSWEVVFKELTKAKNKYGQGGRLGWRKVGRKMGDMSAAISPVFGMIPDEMGLSILKGGLALIFRVSCVESIPPDLLLVLTLAARW